MASNPIDTRSVGEPRATASNLAARSIARLLTRATVEEICSVGEASSMTSRLRALALAGTFPAGLSRSSALGALAGLLSRRYRSEFVFKNSLANNLLFGTYSPNTATLLQEFRVGRSKADCVLINGSAHAYEIKTGLDSADKLRKQLDDYEKTFRLVSVITDEQSADRYAALLEGTSTGLVVLTGRNRLSVRRAAVARADNLSVETMMRALRRSEYTQLTLHATGTLPDAPNGVYFRRCLEAVSRVPVDQVHRLWEDQLRSRRLKAAAELAHEDMRPIRHLCVDINPDIEQAVRLGRWLAEPVG